MSMHWRSIVGLTVAAWLAAACASSVQTPPQDGASAEGGAPQWYAQPAVGYPFASYLVGRGACGSEAPAPERVQCAVMRAREDAVITLRSKVTAVQEQSCRARWTRTHKAGETTSNKGVSGCDSTLASRAEGELELTNAGPAEQACAADGRCYALVVFSRADLAAAASRKGDPLRAQFEDLVRRARTSGAPEALRLLAQALALAPNLEENADLVAAVTNAAPESMSFARIALDARSSVVSGLAVCVKDFTAGAAGTRLFVRTVETLSAAGISQVAFAPSCQSATLTIAFAADGDVTLPAPSRDMPGSWTAERRGTVSIDSQASASARGADAGAKALPVSGRGLARSAQQAMAQAEEQLGQSINRAVSRLVLGTSS